MMGRAIARALCAWRDHRWRPYTLERGRKDPYMRYAVREFCERCEANRLTFEDRSEAVFDRDDVVRLAPAWLEALYRARWGEWPRRRVTMGGAFPVEWQW